MEPGNGTGMQNFDIEVVQVLEILPHERQGPVYTTHAIQDLCDKQLGRCISSQ